MTQPSIATISDAQFQFEYDVTPPDVTHYIVLTFSGLDSTTDLNTAGRALEPTVQTVTGDPGYELSKITRLGMTEDVPVTP